MKINIYTKYGILITVLVSVIFYIQFFYIKNIENIENIVSDMSTSCGFFSMFFFTLNHYIYCKQNKINFKMDTSKWKYKTKIGWTDYFENVELKYNLTNILEKLFGHGDQLFDCSIQTYKDAIPELYIYNNNTKNEINNVKSHFNLTNGNYDSIYIRRGDKLASESKYYEGKEYIELLLKKNPNCKQIFLQTDDYNAYIEVKQYIDIYKLNIQIYTTCDENITGMVESTGYINEIIESTGNVNHRNNKYLNSIMENIKNTKTISEMNSDEIYKHTLELITGIDILINSNICICDFQSSVSRFVKLTHKNSDNVFDIINPDIDIDYNKTICPAYSF